MKVFQLIHELTLLNKPDADVLLYINEDFGTMRAVLPDQREVEEDDQLYCKGCSFDEFHKYEQPGPYIILSDE